MEEYINDKTIMKNTIYIAFKNLITCSLCSSILINPVMCMKCQTAFCKKCADNWSQNNSKCPKGCPEPNYDIGKTQKEMLSKLEFKCQKCENEFLYDEAEKHIKSCKPKEPTSTPTPISANKNSNPSNPNGNITPQKKIEKLSLDQMIEIQNQGIDLSYITSKNKFFYLFFLFN